MNERLAAGKCKTKAFSKAVEAFISCPQFCVGSEQSRRQKVRELWFTVTKMIYPDRGIYQNHDLSGADWRRETDFKFGCEPPNVARRRALSRSINACRLSRSKAVFSFTPVNFTASAYKSSSIFSVVRIATLRC